MDRLDIINVSKQYGDKIALDDVSCTLSYGIYGLVGPNGAGKSTFINIISTIIHQTKGEVMYNNEDISNLKQDYRMLLGIMPQNQKGYDGFSGYHFLLYIASLKGLKNKQAIEEINKLVNVVGLQNDIHRKIKTYSGGMRQRLMLVQALIGNPKIIILDEPTAGLDPLERIKVRNYISQFSKDRIIIIATHIMQDIESIADEIILVKKGRFVFAGKIDEALNSIRGKVYSKEIKEKELSKLQYKYKISNISKKLDGLIVRFVSDEPLDWARQEEKVNLEEVYLHYLV